MGSTSVMRAIEGAVRDGFNVQFGNVVFNALPSGTTAYTLSRDDNGRTINIVGADAVTITIPVTLQKGFTCDVIITNAGGTVTFAAGAGQTLNALLGLVAITGPYGKASVLKYSSTAAIVYGDLA